MRRAIAPPSRDVPAASDPGDLGISGFSDAVEIAHGSFGVVYRAWQPGLNRTIAVKLLSPGRMSASDARRFEREIHIMGRLSNRHHGIVTIHDAGVTADGRPYIVMEDMGGGSLQQHVDHGLLLPWQAATALGHDIANALGEAHCEGVLHRDIKPANLVVSTTGQVKIADFGIARMRDADVTANVVHLSVAHAPPEVLNRGEPTSASDVYSLASTLLTLILGRPPAVTRPGEPVSTTVARIVAGLSPTVRSTDLPEPIMAVFAGALAADPEQRPVNGAAFAVALRDALTCSGLSLDDCRRQAIALLRSHAATLSEDGRPTAANGHRATPAPARPRGRTRPSLGADEEATVVLPPRRPARAPRPGSVSQGEPRRSWWTRWATVVAALIVLAIVAASVATVLVRRSSPTPPSRQVDAANTGGRVWTRLPSMLTARRNLGAAMAADGRIYVVGGVTGTRPLGTVEVYTPSTDRWTELAPLPTPREGPAVVAGPDGLIYAIGGTNGSNAFPTVEAYNPATDTWVERAPLPGRRRALAAVTGSDGRIYAIGGVNDSASLTTTEAYDVHTNSWAELAPMPTARDSLAATIAADGRIYVIGGTDGSVPLATVEAYDWRHNTWSEVTPMRTARWGLAVVTGADRRIYVIGGNTGTALVSTVEVYDPATGVWSMAPPFPMPIGGLAAVSAPDGRIYAMGGRTGLNYNRVPLSILEAYGPLTGGASGS